MKKLHVFILSLVILTFGFSISSAQRMKENKRIKNNIFSELNLSDTQRETIKDIRFTHEALKIDLAAELKKIKLQTKKLLSNKEIEKSSLFNLVEKSTSIELEMKKNRINMWLKIREELNEDQRKIWANRFLTQNRGFMGKFGDERLRHKMRNHKNRNK